MVYFVIRNFWGKGGTEKFVLTLAEKFYEKGVKVQIITGGKKIFKKIYINKIKIVEIFSPSIRFLGTFLYYFSLGTYLFFHRKQYRIIFVFFLKHSAFISILLSKLLKKKVICRISGGGKFGDINSLKKIIGYKIILSVLKKADAYIVLSNFIKKELINEGFDEKKIHIIPNGVDIKKFYPEKIKKYGKTKIITFVGRLTHEKGLFYLLKALKKIKFSGFELFLLGEGPLEKDLKEFVKKIGLEEKVKFWGYQQDVFEFLQMSDLFVLPSISEGMSNALLEAMACGLPIVATEVSGSADLIEDGMNGFLVKPGDIKGLAKAIENILKDEKMAKMMGEANRQKIVENYSIDKIVDRYIALYKTLL